MKLNRIKIVMAEEDADVAGLAAFLKIRREMISLYRSNTTQPSLKTLIKIAEYLHRQPGDLLVTLDFPAGPSPAEVWALKKEKKPAAKKSRNKKK